MEARSCFWASHVGHEWRVHPLLLPGCISRQLDRKWSSQELNRRPYGMPALQQSWSFDPLHHSTDPLSCHCLADPSLVGSL